LQERRRAERKVRELELANNQRKEEEARTRSLQRKERRQAAMEAKELELTNNQRKRVGKKKREKKSLYKFNSIISF